MPSDPPVAAVMCGTESRRCKAAPMERVVVVGASLAGLRACEALRIGGFEGDITLVGAETHVPYDRPPLSKKLLAGDWEPDRIRLRKEQDLHGLRLALHLGTRATGLDIAARTVALADRTSLPFDGLVIATGAAPRRLPGQPDLAGIHELRTLDDSMALRDALAEGVRVVVIGAGFIGLEVAATARQRGCAVTVLEGAPAPLIRGLGAELGTAVAAVHARHGVDVRCGVQVVGLEGGSSVTGVRIAGPAGAATGAAVLVPADIVVVGIGVAPAVGWLEGSGLTLRDGVVCDSTLNVGVPGIYAVGDCARWVNPVFGDLDGAGEEMRVEHWTNAAEQGAAAAANLLAVATGIEPTPYSAVPFFWSDQFESRIQFVGRAAGLPDEEVRVVRGDTSGAFVALYGHAGRLRGALGVNSPRWVMPYRKLLLERATFETALAYAESAR
jgi:NADPH-dependent 2,4-dienoyl-CoA reductase/sulfur reductase-like enzyme